MEADFYILVSILMCYIYVIMAQFFAHKKFNYIHQTSIAIILGTIFGVFVYFFTDLYTTNDFGKVFRNIIFLILLPPMLFEDGYNIKKRKFFQNIMYINLYGILGTIMNFFIIFGILYAFTSNGLVTTAYDNVPIYLQNWQLLAISACLCSIDTVVSEKIINPQRYPKLFSIIFGESMMKDTITVTLFDSIIGTYNKLQNIENLDLDASVAGWLILEFFIVIICSILIGIFSGIICTLIFKHFRFLLSQKGISEVALIIMTGYGGYIVSEWCKFSGVISMLFCGITLSHFNIYNLTEEGKSATKITVSVLALLAEGILFFLLGAFIFNIQTSNQYYFSWIFVLLIIGLIFIARFINVYLISLIGYIIIGKDKWRLNYYEYQIIFVSGLVKGAVSFALIMSCPIISGSSAKVNQINMSTNCMQITVIIVIYLGSLFWNSLLPKVLRNRRKKIVELKKEDPEHPSLEDSLLVNPKSIGNSVRQSEQNLKTKFIDAENIAFYSKMKSTTQKYFKKCEEGFLKPHLIYDYYSRKQEIKQQKVRQRKEECEQYWQLYEMHADEDQSVQQNKEIDLKIIEMYQSDEEESEEQIMGTKVKKSLTHSLQIQQIKKAGQEQKKYQSQ